MVLPGDGPTKRVTRCRPVQVVLLCWSWATLGNVVLSPCLDLAYENPIVNPFIALMEKMMSPSLHN